MCAGEVVERKEFSVNATPVRQKELVGSLQYLFFAAGFAIDVDNLQVRRRFWSEFITSGRWVHYDALLRYMRILAQRSSFPAKERREQELAVWDAQLAKQAAIITRYRLAIKD